MADARDEQVPQASAGAGGAAYARFQRAVLGELIALSAESAELERQIEQQVEATSQQADLKLEQTDKNLQRRHRLLKDQLECQQHERIEQVRRMAARHNRAGGIISVMPPAA